MKTYRNLYPQITAFQNLYQAFRLARRGKRGRAAVAGFEFDLEGRLLELQADLQAQTYQPGDYHNFFIFEPKRRLVSAAPFRDRVVHHALCRVIEPIWEARFIYHSYACRVGKGTHAALNQAHAWVKQYGRINSRLQLQSSAFAELKNQAKARHVCRCFATVDAASAANLQNLVT